MRILIASNVPRKRSVGYIVTSLLEGFQKAGHTVRVCYGYIDESVENEIYHRVTPKWEFYASTVANKLTGYEGIFNPIGTKNIIKEIEQFKPDIVQLMSIHGHWMNSYQLLDYLKKSNIPTVYSMMDEYPLLGKCYFSKGCEGFCDACSNCPKENHILFRKGCFNRAKTIYRWKEKAYSGFDKLYFVGGVGVLGKAMRSTLLSKKNPILINEPQDFDRYYFPQNALELREEFGIAKGNKVVLCVAVISNPRKGGQIFFELCKKMRDKKGFSFVLVGYDTDKYGKPDNLITIPYVDTQEELAKYYSLADVSFSGTIADTTPNAVLQSLGCGTPVVGFDFEGLSCMGVTDKRIMNLVKINDLDAAEQAIIQMSKDDEIINLCRNAVYENYGASGVVNKYLDLYKSILY